MDQDSHANQFCKRLPTIFTRDGLAPFMGKRASAQKMCGYDGREAAGICLEALGLGFLSASFRYILYHSPARAYKYRHFRGWKAE